jgi:hypothetical protein
VKRTGVPQVGMAIRPCWLLPTLPAAQPSDPFRSKQRGSRTVAGLTASVPRVLSHCEI